MAMSFSHYSGFDRSILYLFTLFVIYLYYNHFLSKTTIFLCNKKFYFFYLLKYFWNLIELEWHLNKSEQKAAQVFLWKKKCIVLKTQRTDITSWGSVRVLVVYCLSFNTGQTMN